MKVEAFSLFWLKYVRAEFHVFQPFTMENVRRYYKVLDNQPYFHCKNKVPTWIIFPFCRRTTGLLLHHVPTAFGASLQNVFRINYLLNRKSLTNSKNSLLLKEVQVSC
jgi:hypothetical protein